MVNKKVFLYAGKYIWYKSLSQCLKGSRVFFSDKAQKYKCLMKGIALPGASAPLSKISLDIAKQLGKYPYQPFDTQKLSLQTIKDLIANPEIKVVSFDVFDTLLYRPCFNPTDLFYLIANKVNALYNIDFVALRLKAEEELHNPYATLQDIYNHIQKKHKLAKSLVSKLYSEELACEQQVLAARKDIMEIYCYALSKQKRVIAVSDMYLPSSFLKEVLSDKGYKDIAEIYVSNEYQARKDDGALFKKVVQHEAIQNDDMLHIGDNKKSDVEIPLNLHIPAVYYPSLKDIIFNKKSIYQSLLLPTQQLSEDPVTRILLAFGLFRSFNDGATAPKGPAMWDTVQQFVNIVVGPVLFYTSHFMATNREIQSSYDCVHFAARDGFLPKIAYDILAKYLHLIPSNYLYASRRAYYPLFYNSVEDFIKDSIHLDSLESLTFQGLLEQIIIDRNVLDKIFHKLPSQILQALVKQHLDKCLKSLQIVHEELQEYIQTNRNRATAYYRKQLVTTTGRELVFDLGYSGSISRALSKIAGCPVDKVYFWQTNTNIKSDKKDGTKTFSLFNDDTFRQRLNLLYEEIFSPLQGSSLGFDRNLQPILEKLSVSRPMHDLFNTIRTETENFMEDICYRFGNYITYLKADEPDALHRIVLYMLEKSPYGETALFKDVIFPDPLAMDEDVTLESKLSISRNDNVFYGTGFDNPNRFVCNNCVPHKEVQEKIGIHLHLFHLDIAQELLSYLVSFPFPFDLYITVPKDRDVKEITRRFFNACTLRKVRQICILETENRGRDVAPWLVDMRPYQKQYDLFCHLHTKKSVHMVTHFSSEWREYLYSSLLSTNAVRYIFYLFESDKSLGLLFPEGYTGLLSFCIDAKIKQEGMYNEIRMINQLTRAMGFKRTFCYNTLYFSLGTMMWYRPKALKALFDLNLTYQDFPQEPIGVGGTLAHAIERLPAFVSEESGYKARMYTLR